MYVTPRHWNLNDSPECFVPLVKCHVNCCCCSCLVVLTVTGLGFGRTHSSCRGSGRTSSGFDNCFRWRKMLDSVLLRTFRADPPDSGQLWRITASLRALSYHHKSRYRYSILMSALSCVCCYILHLMIANFVHGSGSNLYISANSNRTSIFNNFTFQSI